MLNMMLLNPSQPGTNSPQNASAAATTSATTPGDFAARLQNLVDVQQGAKKATGDKHTPQEILLSDLIPSELKPGVELVPGDQVQPLPIELPAEAPLMAASTQGTQPLATQQNNLSEDMLARIEQAQALAKQLNQGHSAPTAAVQDVNSLFNAQNTVSPTTLPSSQTQQLASMQPSAAMQQVMSEQNSKNMQPSAMAQTLKAGNNQLATVNSQTLTASQTAALQMAMQLSGQERASLPAGAFSEGNTFLADAKLPPTPQQPMPTWQPLATPVPIKQAMPTAESALQGMNSLTNVSTSANGEQANLAAMQAASTNVASSNASPTSTLTAPLASNAWQQQLSQQVVNMNFRQDNQVALRLHPAELGPLMINLRMDDQAASLQFSATNANVRAAVETAIPQLREILAENGIELSESSVNDGQAEQQNQEQSSGSSEVADNSLSTPTQSTEESSERELDIQVGNGQIDLYA
ncbi:hypothetical protein CWE13_11740 [Aliidiomarina shirensis]|uniref:Flagellar hook-length control protein-like C-terminal domain-containing protein n=1 Tax=Aliidiomarina shirensis TaxID=1048642 RepID=A0A432WP85_9GAMM|nr:flagellar hook-length control protein FliK [Aliidiomarina shirensis]RUO35593.1 hypothetical protein CWE13_11740 [Aliidiomarina shirensis]